MLLCTHQFVIDKELYRFTDVYQFGVHVKENLFNWEISNFYHIVLIDALIAPDLYRVVIGFYGFTISGNGRVQHRVPGCRCGGGIQLIDSNQW